LSSHTHTRGTKIWWWSISYDVQLFLIIPPVRTIQLAFIYSAITLSTRHKVLPIFCVLMDYYLVQNLTLCML